MKRELPSDRSAGGVPASRSAGRVSRDVVSGRLVAAALAEADRADLAEALSTRLHYLSRLDAQLFASLDERHTRETISHVALPELDAWAVIDLVETDGEATRLALVHPNSEKRVVAEALNAGWEPRENDPIGYAAAKRAGKTIAIVDHVDEVLAAAAHTPQNQRLLSQLGCEACLIVPLRIGGKIDGAITFMSALPRAAYTDDEVSLAERIAKSCERALGNARRFAEMDTRLVAAERSNRSRTDMLGNITHELRTPLSAIGGYAELMELGIRGPVTDDQKVDLQRIRWNQQHLLSLITQILAYVRVETRRVDFAITDVDLSQAAREAAEMVEPLMAEKQQRVDFAAPAGSPIGRADVEKVRQIMINLITNAMKYSPAGSVIEIRSGGSPTKVFVDVADMGKGIPADQLDAIFEPFVQLPDAAKSRAGGVGLGLSIARELARGMRGDLTEEQCWLGLHVSPYGSGPE